MLAVWKIDSFRPVAIFASESWAPVKATSLGGFHVVTEVLSEVGLTGSASAQECITARFKKYGVAIK